MTQPSGPNSIGLSAVGPVTISRDEWGIGHATSPDAAGAFAAQGWLAASDRMWQMEWDRRRAFGTWAEVAGPSAVAEDKLFRRIGLAARARVDWEQLHPDTKAMTAAYARGVNAWLDTHLDDLPAEFDAHPEAPEQWEPWHSVAVYQIRHFFMGTFHRKLWRGAVAARTEPALVRAMVDAGEGSAIISDPSDRDTLDLMGSVEAMLADIGDDLAALPDDEVGLPDEDGASNSWAIHGSRTASGAPLLAGDPHRGTEFPNVYYQCHIACDRFDVIGLSFPGVPGFPHFGHNRDVAWCITHGMADDTDVFVEHGQFDVERTETIKVFGASPIEVTCGSTPRGPIVLGDPESGTPCLSVQWTPWHGADTTFDALGPMLEATNVDQFETSLRSWVVPVNSVLSADRSGNISYQMRGRLVERAPLSRWVPVPGNDQYSWDGIDPVGFDQLHHWRNPDRGFLVTANNRISDAAPYVSLDFAGPARHDRIVELLSELDPDTTDAAAMQDIHRDVLSLVAIDLLAILAQATPETEGGRAAQGLLAGWDCEITAESYQATIYNRVRLEWVHEVGRRLGVTNAHLLEANALPAVSSMRALHGAAHQLLVGDGWKLLPGLGPDGLGAVLGQLFDRAAADLSSRLGPDPTRWRWDRVHLMVSPHPLALARPEMGDLHPPEVGVPGDNDTVRSAAVNPVTGDKAAAGSVARYVFDLADWDRSGWVVPHGVSGVRARATTSISDRCGSRASLSRWPIAPKS